MHATIEGLLETVFSVRSVPRLSNEDHAIRLHVWLTRAEAGSNTSTVTLRVVGGDEKRSLKSGTVRYSHESQGTRIREKLRWRGPAAYKKDRPMGLYTKTLTDWPSQCNFDFDLITSQSRAVFPNVGPTPHRGAIRKWTRPECKLTVWRLLVTIRAG
jgi:hypothetical protein